jgi:hypothetical protein
MSETKNKLLPNVVQDKIKKLREMIAKEKQKRAKQTARSRVNSYGLSGKTGRGSGGVAISCYCLQVVVFFVTIAQTVKYCTLTVAKLLFYTIITD